MRLDTLGLQAFVAVADKGGFQAAARAINLSQTALSHRVAKLEAELGVLLFDRTTRSISLTQEGSSLLPRVRRLMHELHDSLHDIRLQGKLRRTKIELGCVPTLAARVLPPILAEFARQGQDYRVRVFDGYASSIADKVDKGELQFGLTVRRATHAQLSFRPLLEERFVVVCRDGTVPAGTGAGGGRVTLDDVRRFRLIHNRISAEALAGSDQSVDWHYEAENVDTSIEMARTGMGVAIVPALGLRDVSRRELATLDLDEPAITRVVGLLRRPDLTMPDGARELMQLIEARVPQAGPDPAPSRPGPRLGEA